MGRFQKNVYSNSAWSEAASGSDWLSIDIHDSDFATVEFCPKSGQGLFYLRFEPRDYFEEPAASADVDVRAEARALADWLRIVESREVDPALIDGAARCGGAGG
ncbi:MAG: hypothetical protein JF592_18920 [Microbacterium sp.]|uniref:hypothetical protein n=1 Tax=Microbacterium sp. TaxID=51671 RepID=UPI001D319D56|nr:hypothetical protein [Microbacterium sp.]MBW8764621.1 hypothetical protein [Microbacterium sp.]